MSFQSIHGSGWYDRCFTRLVRDTSKDSFGGTEYTFVDSGNAYWGSLEQTGSVEVDERNRTTTHTTARIVLRGWLTLTTLDRLVDTEWDETYIITSIARGDDEIIVEAYK